LLFSLHLQVTTIVMNRSDIESQDSQSCPIIKNHKIIEEAMIVRSHPKVMDIKTKHS
jgi:hypothetical protein